MEFVTEWRKWKYDETMIDWTLFPLPSSLEKNVEPVPFLSDKCAQAPTRTYWGGVHNQCASDTIILSHFEPPTRAARENQHKEGQKQEQSLSRGVTALGASHGTVMMNCYQQHTYSNDPEVVPESNLESLSYRLAESGPQKEQYITSGQQYYTQHGAPVLSPGFKDAPKPWNGKTRLVLIGSAALIAIVSGVIGGIVGWQVTEKRLTGSSAYTDGNVGSSGTSTGSGKPSSSGSASGCISNGTLTSASVVRNGSALAATGWRYGDEHVIWLYFQGSDDTLRYVVYDTMYGAWAGPTMLSLEEGAVAGTALTATTLLWARSTGAPPEPQPQLVYQDTSGNLKGIAWYV